MGKVLSMICAVIITGLSGCAYLTPEPAVHVPSTAEMNSANQPRHLSEGSLWVETNHSAMFLDNRARGVGDTLVVNVVQTSTAESKAGTSTGRDSSVNASMTNIFGMPASMGLSNLWGKGRPFDLGVNAGMTSDFKGTGSTTRGQTISSTMTALVVDVQPNGNLMIAGKRESSVNREREIMVVSGIVRPEDIGPDNSIMSTQIADARIVYSGAGVVSDKQGPGWLTRILDNVWPF